jgi:hypothetical protein
MASCPRIASCPLFQQLAMKSSLKVRQAYDGEGGFGRCERFELVAAEKPVPANLLPNGGMLDVPLERLEAKHMV